VFTRLSGNIHVIEEPLPTDLVQRYRERHEASVLNEIASFQRDRLAEGARYATRIRQYWWRNVEEVTPYDASGTALGKRGKDWQKVHFRVSEVEDFFRRKLKSKLPDTAPFNMANGDVLYPHELLFLMPIRDLGEGKEDTLTDVNPLHRCRPGERTGSARASRAIRQQSVHPVWPDRRGPGA
jgi:hypothetical protein